MVGFIFVVLVVIALLCLAIQKMPFEPTFIMLLQAVVIVGGALAIANRAGLVAL